MSNAVKIALEKAHKVGLHLKDGAAVVFCGPDGVRFTLMDLEALTDAVQEKARKRRDKFAEAALTGLISRGVQINSVDRGKTIGQVYAEHAFVMADAMENARDA